METPGGESWNVSDRTISLRLQCVVKKHNITTRLHIQGDAGGKLSIFGGDCIGHCETKFP